MEITQLENPVENGPIFDTLVEKKMTHFKDEITRDIEQAKK